MKNFMKIMIGLSVSDRIFVLHPYIYTVKVDDVSCQKKLLGQTVQQDQRIFA